MNNCPNGDIRDVLPDLLNGRLGAAERSEVEAHVRECSDCQAELELLRSMRSALWGAPAVDVDSIVASIPQYRAPARLATSRNWGGWRIAAAVALLAAGGTSVVVGRNDDGAPVASVAAAPRELTLAGGTIGELDDSELSALIDDIGTLDAVTPADVDNAAAAGPIAPSSPSGTND